MISGASVSGVSRSSDLCRTGLIRGIEKTV
jgi:hypothetical protein